MDSSRRIVLVNEADWPDKEAPPIPAGWPVANAPRPLAGQLTWTGPFRHGIFYAASPRIPEGTFGWEADDGWRVETITNAAIRELCEAKVREHGYAGLDAAAEEGIEFADIVAMLGLPWHDRGE